MDPPRTAACNLAGAFSTAPLAQFITYRSAQLIYWFNIFWIGSALYAGRRYPVRARLVRTDIDPPVIASAQRRIVTAHALYALSALLCVVSTYASIVFIVVIRLNYAIAPRLPLLRRL